MLVIVCRVIDCILIPFGVYEINSGKKATGREDKKTSKKTGALSGRIRVQGRSPQNLHWSD